MRSIADREAIGIVGLGLVGGSLAKALHARFPKQPLIGVEPDAKTRRLVRSARIFENLLARPSEELARCRMVVLCPPVPAILRLLAPVSRFLPDGAVLTDAGGVKEPIVSAAARYVRRGVFFVGAHPMFGGEAGGFEAARGDLWKAGTVAVCTDGADAAAVRQVARLHRALGARVALCAASEHDAAVAVVSHLPYLVASALVLSLREAGPLASKLAARGILSTTRMAAFAYRVQGEAARANRRLPAALRNFERTLGRLRRALASSQDGAKEFRRALQARQSLERASRGR